jgi:D-tyrosyl-tRNA(Tyr) deacylase
VRVLLQRARRARILVAEEPVASIDQGLVAFVAVGADDDEAVIQRLADKVVRLRIFDGEKSKFDRSLLDTDGELLAVSQFTLYADTRRGRRPSFFAAAPPERARALYERFVEQLRALGVRRVESGPFGARMVVEVENWGPFSIWLDSAETR